MSLCVRYGQEGEVRTSLLLLFVIQLFTVPEFHSEFSGPAAKRPTAGHLALRWTFLPSSR
jgi:hypothetical protein